MADYKLVVSSSPHLKTAETTPRLMGAVLLALAPAGFASIVLFGGKALLVIAASVVAALAAEAICNRVMRRPLTIGDGSAAITGLLLAFNMPPEVPLWVPVIGSFFAIVVVKQLFGGLGHNFMNPALAARAFLLAAWPMAMTTGWVQPFDGVTSATPLQTLRGMSSQPLPELWELLFGLRAGALGETCAVALVLGGLYLIARRVIDWRIPAGFVGTVALFGWAFGGRGGYFTGDALAHVLSGGLLLGAFFMATDYVTSPVTSRGRVVMGIGCGVITSLIRLWGGFPEGVSYSILLMNVATPLIDRATMPRVFGQRPARAA